MKETETHERIITDLWTLVRHLSENIKSRCNQTPSTQESLAFIDPLKEVLMVRPERFPGSIKHESSENDLIRKLSAAV